MPNILKFTLVLATVPIVLAETNFGVIVDAGSSGSRARVFEWDEDTRLEAGIPDIQEIWSYKVKPGISSYANDLDGLAAHVQDLINRAKENVPADRYGDTPIYFLATAGMRLLVEDQADDVMNRIEELLSDPEVNPFQFKPGQSRILSGEEEATFAWIAVNYLRGFFSGNTSTSVGVLELGGASTQIAFEPAGILLAGKFPVKLAGVQYSLYTHSYLYYGQDLVNRWVKERLVLSQPNTPVLENPCMLEGDPTGVDEVINGRTVSFVGTSDPDGCGNLLNKHVIHNFPRLCNPKPCAIGAVYQPTIDEAQEFYTVSAFTFYPKNLNVLHEDGTVILSELNDAAVDFCKLTFEDGKEMLGEEDKYVSMNCIMGLYLPRLLSNGYHFDPSSTQVKSFSKINNHGVEWSLGAMIYESELEICRREEE